MKYHGLPLSDFLPLTVWPICIFTTLLVFCFFIFRPLRKKGNKTAKILTIVLPIIGWSIWHFYPSVTVEGTYVAKFQYLDSEDTSIIVITDKFKYGDDGAPIDYELVPIFRALVIDPEGEYPMGVKLSWDSVHCYVLKAGTVKHKKQK